MVRVAAWSCVRGGALAPLRRVERVAQEAGLDDRDRGLVRALVGTEIRRRATLRAILTRFTRAKPKPNPDLAAHLRLGLVQILFMDRIPDHAAVAATIDAVARTLGHSKGRLARTVLRDVIAGRRPGASGDPRRDLVGRPIHLCDPVFHDPDAHPLLWGEDALSIPAHLIKRWVARHGRERAEGLARGFLEEPALAVRAVGTPPSAILAELEAAGAEPRPASHPRIALCPSGRTEQVLGSPAFAAGRITIQGETQAAAAELLGAVEGESVLDLCAAPGGKTALLAESGATVTAVDVDAGRLEALRSTVARLGLEDRVEIVRSDGVAELARRTFDAALVDAPCSNTGVLGARPGARWRFGPKNLAALTALQARLLGEAASRVRPGGRLVWSTCSLEPEENGRQVRAFLERHPPWRLEVERETLPGPEGPGDGGFAARLAREG